ncbi:hypothetical protein BS47DRAFT_855811 [Hydnum rufescens UP504]|uniref:VHS domain-containing protein n=1 Tax=Hydnum rufescens UP504 TaxID=1448309 RepID=A0A9P6AZ47_9AGAM|nr:hypothetical protein BS47DRAFT_855811 [Hydnum rufescens UP504]
MASDPLTNDRVKKKLMSVLWSWHHQFKDDPKMRLIAGLYHACGGPGAKQVVSRILNSTSTEHIRDHTHQAIKSAPSASPASPTSPRFEAPRRKAEEGARERKEAERREREAAKRKTKVEKEATPRKARVGVFDTGTTKRKTFDLEKVGGYNK